MGIARLLAKGWIVFCLFAGGARLAPRPGQRRAAGAIAVRGGHLRDSVRRHGPVVRRRLRRLGRIARHPFKARLGLHHLMPGFNEIVFLFSSVLSFVNQVWFAPRNLAGDVVGPLERRSISSCRASARWSRRWMPAAWMAGASSPPPSPGCWRWSIWPRPARGSNCRRASSGWSATPRPEGLGPSIRAFCLGVVAVVGVQFLFVGSAYPWLNCSAFDDITGALLIGLAPLMLAYLVVRGHWPHSCWRRLRRKR